MDSNPWLLHAFSVIVGRLLLMHLSQIILTALSALPHWDRLVFEDYALLGFSCAAYYASSHLTLSYAAAPDDPDAADALPQLRVEEDPAEAAQRGAEQGDGEQGGAQNAESENAESEDEAEAEDDAEAERARRGDAVRETVGAALPEVVHTRYAGVRESRMRFEDAFPHASRAFFSVATWDCVYCGVVSVTLLAAAVAWVVPQASGYVAAALGRRWGLPSVLPLVLFESNPSASEYGADLSLGFWLLRHARASYACVFQGGACSAHSALTAVTAVTVPFLANRVVRAKVNIPAARATRLFARLLRTPMAHALCAAPVPLTARPRADSSSGALVVRLCVWVRRTFRSLPVPPGWEASEVAVRVWPDLRKIYLSAEGVCGIECTGGIRLVLHAIDVKDFTVAGVFVARFPNGLDVQFQVWMPKACIPSRYDSGYVRFAASRIFTLFQAPDHGAPQVARGFYLTDQDGTFTFRYAVARAPAQKDAPREKKGAWLAARWHALLRWLRWRQFVALYAAAGTLLVATAVVPAVFCMVGLLCFGRWMLTGSARAAFTLVPTGIGFAHVAGSGGPPPWLLATAERSDLTCVCVAQLCVAMLASLATTLNQRPFCSTLRKTVCSWAAKLYLFGLNSVLVGYVVDRQLLNTAHFTPLKWLVIGYLPLRLWWFALRVLTFYCPP
ncbi:putative transmembrane protein [Gregarina niphandrodes]|uniref:Transmembrane protein n=1 Tax=Gregarina niphandrodes TaxID=110365 RepID=A0A023B877_GRENI|nr:putative transmembrane protein [Gregarina niphandrodes]EZG68296.1 putative transmembrane protein [Gregarina niphandrodes]|eukprot:XP_011134596.1 putative transmembrane protein [Gregarina niphandrodes]